MPTTHNLGFPRIGAQRELKVLLEAYWRGELDAAQLQAGGVDLRRRHWQLQAEAGLDLLPVGDFSWYDQVLDHALLFGVIPARFRELTQAGASVQAKFELLFAMARGRPAQQAGEASLAACEMTKWFDTNYHYLVPEFSSDQTLRLDSSVILEPLRDALALGYKVKPVLLGPLSLLWLGKTAEPDLDRLQLIHQLLPLYKQLLAEIAALGVEWVQLDEPILALDLPPDWLQTYEPVYHQLQGKTPRILLASYFGGIEHQLGSVCNLPVAGLHLDLVRAPSQLAKLLDRLSPYKILSLGLIDGRNIWRADLAGLVACYRELATQLGERLWLAPSCSLLHCPVSLAAETELDPELKNCFAFATEKLQELRVLAKAFGGTEDAELARELAAAEAAQQFRRESRTVRNSEVRARLAALGADEFCRPQPFAERKLAQAQRFGLPLFPTTSIGSFPQTDAIRKVRQAYRRGAIDTPVYESAMRAEIAAAIARQEQLGLDVLVHGEAERNDMVEYFGSQFEGMLVTRNGWVQSYGSRCVKPPIIYGDISRPRPMTVAWSRYAQSLTAKPVKGMLTGPVTLLKWSFSRDDESAGTTCLQLALALSEEVLDLERAGIGIIQIDEPALREGLPLRRADWPAYLAWATRAFRLSCAGVQASTQIHTHMCYSRFNDIITAVAELDADVITIETSRSAMTLLDAFRDFRYPNDIGPGVYDIHSPVIPATQDMVTLIRKACEYLPASQLWINPDCGLKTRRWEETEPALRNLVAAARSLRQSLA